VTAAYYLLLKKHLRIGGSSVADARKETYDVQAFARAPRPCKDDSGSGELDVLISQRKIADSLGEMTRYHHHKQEKREKKRASSSYVSQAHATLKAYQQQVASVSPRLRTINP
jgi:hypothetical protein